MLEGKRCTESKSTMFERQESEQGWSRDAHVGDGQGLQRQVVTTSRKELRTGSGHCHSLPGTTWTSHSEEEGSSQWQPSESYPKHSTTMATSANKLNDVSLFQNLSFI